MRSLPRPLAFAFDLDGTLIDSRRDIAAACNHVLARAGHAPLEEAVIATFVGDGARALLARAFGLDRDSPALDEPHDEFVRYYAAHPITHTGWMPGALDAISALGTSPLAIVTNKTRTVTLAILDALGARQRFAAIYGAGDGPLKPSAEPILTVARSLAVAPADLWMVGDAAQDIGAGRAAGSPTVGVCGGFHPEQRLREAGPDRLIASLAELPALVAEARRDAPEADDPAPRRVEILSGGRRFLLRGARFTDVGAGQWQVEFSVAAQADAVDLIEIVRAGGDSLMLSIDGGPVVGGHTRMRPRYQTILSQPIRYEFIWP